MRRTIFPKSFLPVLAAVAALALLGAPQLVAQPPGGGGPGAASGPHVGRGAHGSWGGHHGMLGGRGFERLADALELTDSQRDAARSIHEATRTAVEPVKEQSRTLHQELRGLLDQPAPDPTAVGERVIALEASRSEIRQLFADARADFEALLSAEQLQKLEKAHERRGRRGAQSDGRPGRRGTR